MAKWFQKDRPARVSAKRRVKTIYRPKYGALIAALVQARKESGITQHELAKMLKRSKNYPTKIEKIDRRLDIMEFIDYAKAIGVDPILLLRKHVL